jgi:hypothetical protein
MTRTQIVRWFIRHRDNILRDMHIMSKYYMPGVLPVGEGYVYKNILGIKFFIVKKYLAALPMYQEVKSTFEMPDFFESTVTLKHTSIFEEIYFVDYDSHTDSLTYVYAKDVKSGCYDTHRGLAIDLTKIPKTAINGNMWTSLHNDENFILTLEELFVYKDKLQP